MGKTKNIIKDKQKYFSFTRAVKIMLKGFKVKHSSWSKNDYIFIENGKILCDGGFEYSEYISNELLSSNKWSITEVY